jgi:hypothetical protein
MDTVLTEQILALTFTLYRSLTDKVRSYTISCPHFENSTLHDRFLKKEKLSIQCQSIYEHFDYISMGIYRNRQFKSPILQGSSWIILNYYWFQNWEEKNLYILGTMLAEVV